MADFSQQIEDVEKEIKETPYHKGTEEHIGKLRARLARLNDRVLEGEFRKSRGGGEGYAMKKQGDATVVLIGPPSSGKSTLLNKITNAESKVAAYSFTTVSVIPGMMKYNDAYIQILDVPGLIEGAKSGKGRGKEVLSVARGADLLLIMTDVERPHLIGKMVEELSGAGIRINQKPPSIIIDKKPGGGIIVHTNIPQDFSNQLIKDVALEFGIKNAHISLTEKLTEDRLIDSYSQNRVYLPSLFVVNKIDQNPHYINTYQYNDVIRISAHTGLGLDKLKEAIWEKLRLVKIYLVRPNEKPNIDNPFIVRKDDTLSGVASKLGENFSSKRKFAKIWGPSARFPGQEASLTTKVVEGMQISFQ